MRSRQGRVPAWTWTAPLLVVPAIAGLGLASASDLGRQAIEACRVQGGVIVHLGCGDGRATAALRPDERYTVHGLDRDAGNIEVARRHLRQLGVYGPVSVEHWPHARLPYADNLVNLVVSEDPGPVSDAEVLRVLAPGGAAYLKRDGTWTKTVKPRPGDTDEWTHFLHDAGNNAVAADARVGPPRSLQWMAGPLWLRSHETPSGFQAMVCGSGRIFYILDEGLIGITDQRLPERWAILCRDAFNGKLLWRRPIGSWGWPAWAADRFKNADWTTIIGGRTVVPNENQRRLVVDGDRLYATLDYRAGLSILDAATGKVLASLEETAPARQIVAADGVAVVYSHTGAAAVGLERGDKGKAKAKSKPSADAGESALIAVRGETRAVLWRHPIPPVQDLCLAIDQGRVLYKTPRVLAARDLATGKELWSVECRENFRTLVARDGIVLLRAPRLLEARDGAAGKRLWQRDIPATMGLGDQDLFVIDGVIWPGVSATDSPDHVPDAFTIGKGVHALAVGYDLKTGEERKRVFAANVLSPEHHHRCYRNKATSRYVLVSMEGAEFVDLQGDGHSQNNFLRGACRLGFMPANGMLYVPPDQCFCQPGAKVLGLKAVGPAPAAPPRPEPDASRLVRGPAYEASLGQRPALPSASPPADDWPTFRHDPARHGSTPSAVGVPIAQGWKAKIGGPLTAPVAAQGKVYVAARDAHTLHALELATGRTLWTFVAGGRIDSPPTVHDARVLFGSADGWVYCLRSDDGSLIWRFLAAPCDRRIACFDQIESVWPAHGSVLVRDGIAYASAGRSTYLDGGIALWALDPASGRILHKTTLSGPFPDGGKTVPRDVSFFIRGANSDVLVSEGDAIYMRQKRLTPDLREEWPELLSSKGECDVGLHVFSTAGILDGSWYNRTFWMYARRWPGFQLANQAPKSGQILVVDAENTYAVHPFYRRNVHSPMFFPAKEGYLMFADRNDNEPQIVGEKGSRQPVAWLPQSDYQTSRGLRTLDSEAFGLDKMIGYTRAEPPLWSVYLPIRVRAMVKAGATLFAAGPPDVLDPADPYAAFEGRRGARLVAVSAKTGKQLAERGLDSPPVFDGMIAAAGRLLVAQEDGSLVCLEPAPAGASGR